MPVPLGELSSELASLLDDAADYAARDIAGGSRRGFARDFARWEVWAREHGVPSMPSNPATVAVYLAALARGKVRVRWIGKGGVARESLVSKKYNTIRRAYSAIVYAHRARGIEWARSPAPIIKVMRGIRRTFANDPSKRVRRVDPVELGALSRCLATLGSDMRGLRDRMMLLVGFFGALRRSELAALDVEDIRWTAEGCILSVRVSKVDQFAVGAEVAIERQPDHERCACVALKRWLDAAQITGPLVRAVSKADRVLVRRIAPGSIAALVKGIVEDAGLDPAVFSGHSMRAGLATEAGKQRRSLDSTMKQGRWLSEKQCMIYMRHGSLFVDNATSGLAT